MRRSIWICLLAAWSLLPCEGATVRLSSGRTHSGKLEITPGSLAIVPRDGELVKINLAELTHLSTQDTKFPPDTFAPGVLLVDGTLVAGQVKALEDLAAKFGSAGVTVPQASIAALIFKPVPRSEILESGAKTGGLLPNGDFYEADLVGIREGKATLNSTLFGPKRFQLGGRLLGILLKPVQNNAAVLEVSSRDGSRYMAADLKLEAGSVTLREPLLGEVKIKAADLAEIRIGPGRFQEMTNLKPVRVDAPPGADASAAFSITQAGEGEERAFITSAANVAVTYAVPPGLSLFTCDTEVTSETPVSAKLSFAVYGDGRLLYRTPPRSAGESLEPVKVALGMSKGITLRVESATTGAAIGSGRWLSPSFLKP